MSEIKKETTKKESKPEMSPMLILGEHVIFPLTVKSVEFSETFNINTLKANDDISNKIVFTFRDPKGTIEVDNIKLCKYAVITNIISQTLTKGKTKGVFSGETIVEIKNVKNVKGGYVCDYKEVKIMDDSDGEKIGAINTLSSILKETQSEGITIIRDAVGRSPVELLETEKYNDIYEIVYNIGAIIPMSFENKLNYLKSTKITDLTALLAVDIKSLEKSVIIEEEIQAKIKQKLDEQQKDYYLKEKMNVLKQELDLDGESEMNKIKEDFENNPYPESVKKKALQEIDRYEATPTASAESGVIRNYIEWLHKLPWWQKSDDMIDLTLVREELDKNHFGIDKVKDRIVEYLAVKKKTNSLKSPIICLVGPPGVGKTSLAFSIAHAINRKFQKISMGGVKDESEIRGHRRTYVGALPGRFINAMKKAGVTNPLILIDEIDKMASDWKGDPTSAMLEVLDPEQNMRFNDNYIEEDYDLSDVMFIATANYMDGIPPELRDRLEIIQLSSYTEQEKTTIALEHLIPEIALEHNIEKDELKLSAKDLLFIIQRYTREAGVRELRRIISKLARKVVVKSFEKDYKNVKFSEEVIIELLGKPKFNHTRNLDENQVGVVTGLAYTQFGGDILPIEVNLVPGKGKLVLTGQLGDVMKESAQIALTYVKSIAEKHGIKKEVFVENDFHIHAPEGAVPKDGPSAGITITTALLSALTNKPISHHLGMTGEITLRGKVLPIGGLKEKSISAHRSGLKMILAPSENEKDLDEIPDEVKDKLEIVFVKEYSDVFAKAFK